MKKEFQGIYNSLSKIDKLDKELYEYLISVYGSEKVDLVLELMMEEDECNITKFDYYIGLNLTNKSRKCADDLYGVYLSDVGNYMKLSNEENMAYLRMIHDIINQMNELFTVIDSENNNLKKNKKYMVEDKFNYYIDICKDKDTLEKIRELYDRYIKLRNILVEGNLRLVISVAKSFYVTDVSFNDIIQNGNIGLINAIEKFDPNHGVSFSTYAWFWIRQRIIKGFRIDNDISTTISHDAFNKNNARLQALSQLSNKLGRQPTDYEVAEYMNISVKKLYEIKNAFVEPLSIYISLSEKSYDKPSVSEFIPDNNCDVFETVCFDSMLSDVRKIIYSGVLTERELFVLERRYGLNGEDIHILEDIGKKIGMTREGVRRIQKKAEGKIKAKCKKLVGYIK